MQYRKYFSQNKLWTPTFTRWWLVSLASVFMFDLFWMGQTTFRPMSYFAFYPVLLLSAFVLALPSLFSRNGVIQLVWLLFFDILFIANLMYCRTYFNAIPLHSYGLAGNLADFQASVWESFRWYFIFLPILSIGAFIGFSIDKKTSKKLPSPILYVVNIVVLGIITWAGDAWRGGIMQRMDFMSEYAYLSSSITPIYSLGGYLAHDYYKSTQKLSPAEKQNVEIWLDDHLEKINSYWTDSIRQTRSKPKNLVLILCESLESWVIGAEVEGKVITPNLNRWRKDSTSFYAPNVLTQVGSGRSIEGQLLILTGLMPMNNKVYAYDAVDNVFFSIPKAFKAEGAKTILFTPDKPYVWNQARVAPAFGFDRLIASSDFVIDETTGRTKRLSDGSLMRQIVEKIKTDTFWLQDDKIMLMTVTNSGHNPFDLPQHLRSISFEGDFPKIIKDYMVTAHYTDKALNIMVEYLKSRPDWEETMVVITGDHEGLATDRNAAVSNKISKKFVDPERHTPFLVLNSPITGEFNKEFGQVDLYSSIIDLMQLNNYPWRGLGRSIFDPAFSQEDLNEEEYTKTISDLILKFNLLSNYPPQNSTTDSLLNN